MAARSFVNRQQSNVLVSAGVKKYVSMPVMRAEYTSVISCKRLEAQFALLQKKAYMVDQFVLHDLIRTLTSCEFVGRAVERPPKYLIASNGFPITCGSIVNFLYSIWERKKAAISALPAFCT